MEKKPEKGKPRPPGADYVDPPKKSRRNKPKKEDEPTKAGPSVHSAPLSNLRQAGLTNLGLQTFHHHPLLNQVMDLAHPSKTHREFTFPNDKHTKALLTTIEHRLGQPRFRQHQVPDDLPKSLVSLLKQRHPPLGQLNLRHKRVLINQVQLQAMLIQRARKSKSKHTRWCPSRLNVM